MSEQEIKAAVLGFIDKLMTSRENHANFDFFMFLDVDSPNQNSTGSDVMFVNTFSDYEMYRSGIIMIDAAMRDRTSRDFASHANFNDVSNNSNLRMSGFDGYLVN